MSGIDLVETLARRGIARPTIMIGGRIDEALRRRAEAAGAFALEALRRRPPDRADAA